MTNMNDLDQVLEDLREHVDTATGAECCEMCNAMDYVEAQLRARRYRAAAFSSMNCWTSLAVGLILEDGDRGMIEYACDQADRADRCR